MNVLITYAVDPEFAPWLKLRKFEKVASGGFTIHRTKIGAALADFLVTGMGPGFAKRAMESVQETSYHACICAGFAGSLKPDYAVGEILAPESIRETGQPGAVFCDPLLIESAEGARKARTLLSSPKVITSASEKMQLAPLADAVDMESFTLISAAQERQIPAVAIRVISDAHDQDMPVDFSKSLDERGQVSIAAVLRLLAGEPGKLTALMRVGRESKAAAEKLARFLCSYIGRTFPLQERVDLYDVSAYEAPNG